VCDCLKYSTERVENQIPAIQDGRLHSRYDPAFFLTLTNTYIPIWRETIRQIRDIFFVGAAGLADRRFGVESNIPLEEWSQR